MTRLEAINAFVGKSFNRLTAVKLSHTDKHGSPYWVFLCSCGNTKVIRKNHVIFGNAKSCGCLSIEVTRKRSTLHGRSRIGDRTFSSWASLIKRAKHPPSHSYVGITVSEDWKVFTNFLRDMGERPEGKTIDRIDNTKGYCKENCRWATNTEQARNVRKCSTRKMSSKYKGVYLLKKDVWRAYIKTDEKALYLGRFKTQEDAARAYNEAAIKYHGEFACLNPI